jgi:hypothetical protein
MEANRGTILEINRLAKAIWQFIKSFRIFIRTAISYRQSGEQESYPNDFWVQCPSYLTPDIQHFLSILLFQSMGIRCFQTDINGDCPPQLPAEEGGGRVGFIANLLGYGVYAQEIETPDVLLWEIYVFLLGNEDIVNEMIELGELVNPPMVSYAFPVAVRYNEMWHDAESPEIAPNDGDELGDLGRPSH